MKLDKFIYSNCSHGLVYRHYPASIVTNRTFICFKNLINSDTFLMAELEVDNFPKCKVAITLDSHRENESSSPTGAYMSLDTVDVT